MDKEETKKFVRDTLGILADDDENDGGEIISDEAFEEVFLNFDKDGSGTV